MLNDGVNSLARYMVPSYVCALSPLTVAGRMYAATFSDYFTQAVIDFVLGHRGLGVFTEFMTNMSATDPRELFRLSKVRAIAIETCTGLLVQAGEEIKGGWTLFSPTQPNVTISNSFEEKVLLLVSRSRDCVLPSSDSDHRRRPLLCISSYVEIAFSILVAPISTSRATITH